MVCLTFLVMQRYDKKDRLANKLMQILKRYLFLTKSLIILVIESSLIAIGASPWYSITWLPHSCQNKLLLIRSPSTNSQFE